MEPQSGLSTHDSAVAKWLASFGLSQYSRMFHYNGYEDLDSLWNIKSEDLEYVGVQLAGHRKKLLYHAASLHAPSDDREQNRSGGKADLSYEIWQPDYNFEKSTQRKIEQPRSKLSKPSQTLDASLSHQEQMEDGADEIMKTLERLQLKLENEMNDDLHSPVSFHVHTPVNTIHKLIRIKVFSPDMVNSMSIDIEEDAQCWFVTHQLILQQGLIDSPNWGIFEVIPQFSLQRMLEDHEVVAKADINRTTQKESMLVLKEDQYKYDLFHRSYEYFPAHLCLPEQQTDDPLDGRVESARKMLIDGYLSSDSVPELKGVLFLREGKKIWKQKLIMLRASGLYFSRTGKCRQEKHLSLLCGIDSYEVCIAANYKKANNAPFDFCFALKPLALKLKLGWEDLICFSASSKRIMFSWIAGIRIAKEGGAVLRNNFVSMSDKAKKLIAKRGRNEAKNSALVINNPNSRSVPVSIQAEPPVKRSTEALTQQDFPTTTTKSDQTFATHPSNPLIMPLIHPITEPIAMTQSKAVKCTSNSLIDPVTDVWYHGAISKEESARRIASVGGVDGTFLIRDSMSNRESFVLTMIFQGKFYHYIIQNHGSLFSIDYGPKFSKIQDLYQYYSNCSGGMPCKLTHFCVNISLKSVVDDTLC